MGNTFHICCEHMLGVLSPFLLLAFIGPVDGAGSPYQYDTLHINLPVDHNSSINNKFNLRYLRNDKFWDPQAGAPIFFYAGNGDDVTNSADLFGFIWDTAQQLKALVVFAEHRYYGESLPFGKDTFKDIKNMKYLTVEQALADYVALIENLVASQKKTHPDGRKSPVIAFGTAYGGILSAYLRMKHPDVVTGALASSGNIWNYDGIYDCEGYLRVTTETYKNVNTNCSNNVKKTWDAMNQLGSTANGREKIKSLLSLCEKIENDTDLKYLFDWIKVTLLVNAMYYYPYSVDNYVANTVQLFCDQLSNANLEGEQLIEAFGKGLKSMNKVNSGCTSWNGDSTSTDIDPWSYQICTEMVYPDCSNGVDDMFLPKPWSLEKWSNDCFDQYKVRSDPSAMVSRYGGKNIGSSSNIIFSNGLRDPWSSAGVLESVSPTLVAITMPNAGHCMDLRATNPADPPDVTQARLQFKTIFQQWIDEFHTSN